VQLSSSSAMAADFLTSAHCEISHSSSASVHTVAVSVSAYHTICRLRKGSETEGDVVERALAWLDNYTIVARALGSEELRKAASVVRQMRRAGYNDEVTTAVCRALFGSQSEKDLRKAFKLFTREGVNGARYIDMAEFRHALLLMGEQVDENQVDELFDLVDADQTGHLDFGEFCVLVRGMNPKPGDANRAFEAFRSTAGDRIEAIGLAVGSAASETGSTLTALSSAWTANIRGLDPFQMRKAGLALNNMREAGFSEDVACGLCRAVFCGQSDRQLRRAFRFFDSDHSGLIDAAELRRALPLMGEDVPPDRVDELFASADVDGNSKLTFQEFCGLVRAANPNAETSAGSASDHRPSSRGRSPSHGSG